MLKKLAVIVLLFVLLVVAGGFYGWKQLNQPLALSADQSFSVNAGDSIYKVAAHLQSKQWMEHSKLLAWYARFNGDATRIKTGQYKIQQGTTALQFLQQLVNGHVESFSITFLEGWTVKQAIEALHQKDNIQKTNATANGKALLKALKLEKKYSHIEGLVYPDTYHYHANASDLSILKRANKRLLDSLNKLWPKREKGLPYKSAYEALIMASIIEKETAVASERRQIAGVFVERLEKKMRLQTDPTVIYGMGDKYKGNIRRKDLLEKTPYNTYRINGLPPTPIALPTEASIYAALHPLKTGKLYFVAKGDGTHYFSTTLAEHEKAVRQYQLKRRKNYRSSPE